MVTTFSVVITIIVVILFFIERTHDIIVLSSRYEILLLSLLLFFLPNTNMISPLCPTTMTVDTFLRHYNIFLPYILLFPCSPTVFTFFRIVFVDEYNSTYIRTHRAPGKHYIEVLMESYDIIIIYNH